MDAVLMQNIFTLASAAGFVGIVVWAWSRRAGSDFAEAERILNARRPRLHSDV